MLSLRILTLTENQCLYDLFLPKMSPLCCSCQNKCGHFDQFLAINKWGQLFFYCTEKINLLLLVNLPNLINYLSVDKLILICKQTLLVAPLLTTNGHYKFLSLALVHALIALPRISQVEAVKKYSVADCCLSTFAQLVTIHQIQIDI